MAIPLIVGFLYTTKLKRYVPQTGRIFYYDNIGKSIGGVQMDKNNKIEFWNNEEFGEIFDEASLLQLGVYFYFGSDNIEQDVD